MPEKSFSQAQDKSLQAYKDWVTGLASKMGVKDDMTEEEWIAAWKKFWAKKDSDLKPQKGNVE